MTNLLPKPPWACAIWCDDRHVYLEPPCPEGKAPHIAAYALTEGGLAKALALVRQLSNKDKAAVAPGYFRHGEAKPTIHRSKPDLRPDVAEATRKVLRKMGFA